MFTFKKSCNLHIFIHMCILQICRLLSVRIFATNVEIAVTGFEPLTAKATPLPSKLVRFQRATRFGQVIHSIAYCDSWEKRVTCTPWILIGSQLLRLTRAHGLLGQLGAWSTMICSWQRQIVLTKRPLVPVEGRLGFADDDDNATGGTLVGRTGVMEFQIR